MMSFLETNYVWIIVIGVIILMTIIGYFAEKYDKTKKDKPVKIKSVKSKPKKQTLKETVEEEVPEEEIYNESVALDDWNTLPVEEEQDIDNEQQVELNNDFSIDEQVEEDVLLNDSDEEYFQEPVIDETEVIDNQDESIDIELSNDENDSIDSEVVNEQFSFVEEPFQEEIIEDNKDDLEMTLPSIETLDNEIRDVVEEEDVWKF